MKVLTRTLSLLTIATLALFFANCGGGGGDESSKEEDQLNKLSETWAIVAADLDGDNTRIDDFTNFKLTISGTFDSDNPEGPYQYSVSGSRPDPSPWPASGTWEFVAFQSGDEGDLARIEDSVPMHYKINSSGQLILTVNCAACDYPGARTAEVNGTWTFTFNAE